jgi:hypothetical protein
MAAKRHSKEIRQAAAMLEALSDAKREIVLQLIRCLAEDEDADLQGDPATVADDLAEFERFRSGERSGLVTSDEVLAGMRTQRRGKTSHVPSLV